MGFADKCMSISWSEESGYFSAFLFFFAMPLGPGLEKSSSLPSRTEKIISQFQKNNKLIYYNVYIHYINVYLYVLYYYNKLLLLYLLLFIIYKLVNLFF